MIRAGRQGLLLKQARLLMGGSLRPSHRCYSSSDQNEKEIGGQTFPTLIMENGIYVNKLPKLFPLLKRTPANIALTAPRRMGKSLTLSTLKLIKLLGTADLIQLLDKKGLNDAKKQIEELEMMFEGTDYQRYIKFPQPVTIVELAEVIDEESLASAISGGIKISMWELEEYDKFLDQHQTHTDLSQLKSRKQLRLEMIEQYKSNLGGKLDDLTIFKKGGGLLMIDEYDSVYTNADSSTAQKRFLKEKINLILGGFKNKKCIVAGVYHPATIGFTTSSINSYYHYSSIISANDIAFTKKEVENYYYGFIKEAIKKLPEENKEVLIGEIQSRFKFIEDKEEFKEHKEAIQTSQRSYYAAPVKAINEKFDDEKLAQYVIDVMFWMHDGFNLDSARIRKQENLVIAPSVVLKIIKRIQTKNKTIFKWDDYMESAYHFHIRKLFSAKTYIYLKEETKNLIISLLKDDKIRVPLQDIYRINDSIGEMSPLGVLFQEGLLSVEETFDEDLVLSIPNYGVRQFINILKADLSDDIIKFVAGLFDTSLGPDMRIKQVYTLLTKYQVEAYNFAKKLCGKQSLGERNFTSAFSQFLSSMVSDPPSLILVSHQQTHEKRALQNKSKADKREELMPDITIQDTRLGKKAVFEIFKEAAQRVFHHKEEKYDQLNSKEIETVVLISYDEDFRRIKNFRMFTPSGKLMEKPKKKSKQSSKRKQKGSPNRKS